MTCCTVNLPTYLSCSRTLTDPDSALILFFVHRTEVLAPRITHTARIYIKSSPCTPFNKIDSKISVRARKYKLKIPPPLLLHKRSRFWRFWVLCSFQQTVIA